MLLLTVLWIPALAEAQTEPEWQRGVELRRQGQDAAALEVFAALHARTASPASLAQVALAEQALGRWGAAALDLAYVAAGRYEGFWERRLNAWDLAAGLILLREAGGMAQPMDPGGDILVDGAVIAATEPLFDGFAKIIRG